MATFVLVHGAWRGSWSWKRVRKALTSLGHDVFTPTLTGLGERKHLLSRQVNLETHIADVVNLIECEELTDLVLCGHSYGGCVISGVADRLSDRVRSLVYVDAFMLDDGQCLYDTVPTALNNLQLALTAKRGEGWKVPPIPAEVFNVNAADRQWVNRQCTAHPIDCFQQPLKLSREIQKIKNASFILAEGWKDSFITPFFHKAVQRGWATTTLPCGHDVMLDLPDELTKLLVAAAI